MIAIAFAQEVAAFRRLWTYKNSRPRGASSADDVAVE
jgi:hypothetical protein